MLRTAFFFLSVAALSIFPTHAQEGSITRSPQNGSLITLSFAPVVERIAPSVVNVYAAKAVQPSESPFLAHPFFRDFFNVAPPQERIRRSVGSGVIVSRDGLVITNNHVVEKMTEVRVSLSDKREFEADVLLRDVKSDLAVLKLRTNAPTLKARLAEDDSLKVGDFVLAVGNPFGVGQTVTQGIVSALARTQVGISDYQFFIQTDAAINPGNSGGPLVDVKGRVVGINTAIFSRSGGSQGIGFAIPIRMVRAVLESALIGRKIVRRPWFGAALEKVTSSIAEGAGLDRPVGVRIVKVWQGGNAAKAGVQVGDLIVAIDGKEVGDPEAFNFLYSTRKIGVSAKLTIIRDGVKRMISIIPREPEAMRPPEKLLISGNNPLSGAEIVNITPPITEELGIPFSETGVVITRVLSRSLAQRVGFSVGDVILSINNVRVTSTPEVARALKGAPYEWRLSTLRDGRVITSVFRL